MARKAASKAPKRVAPSKVAKKVSRKEHSRRKSHDSDEDEQDPSEDENYLAFSKQQAQSDDEDYGKEREVFQLDMNEDSDDSDEGEDDDEEDASSASDQDDDDDLQHLVNNLAPELRNKVLNQQSSSESEGESDEDDEENVTNWGRKKKTYYSGDTADLEIGQDVEDALEEEEAAKDLYKTRMKKMAAQDYLDSDDVADSAEDEDDDEESNTLAAQLARQSKRPVEVERVTKSLSHLSKAAKMDILAQSAPELVTLVTDLRERVADLSSRIVPLNSLAHALHTMGKASDDLVDYLQMKQQLMVAYCLDVVYYLYLKAKGASVADHPVMRQMLRLRYAMEKVYSLDAKLQHQINRLLKLREQGVDAKMLESSLLKPNLQALLDEEDEERGEDSHDEEDEGEKTGRHRGGAHTEGDSDLDEDLRGRGAGRAQGVYRPPKLHSTPYPADEPSAKELRKAARASKRVQQSELFEALQEEFGVTPEEAASGGIANVSKDLKRLEQEEKERLAFEEERFVRMTLTRKEKQAIKRRTAEAMRIDNFEDIGDAGDLDNLLVSQPVSGNKRTYEHSGEAAKALERAVRELGEKRSRRAAPAADFEDSEAPRHQHYVPSEDDDDDQDGGRENLFEDFVSKKKAFLDAKASHYTPAPTFAGHDEEVAEGNKRGASYEIIKNRGLTPHRKKENRNARVKKRVAYDKAVKRRKGQIREVGTRAEVGYQGELTGIKANLAHSRRLG